MPNPADLLLPYQLAWTDCPARIAIGEKSRRIGWTYAAAYRAVERRVHLGTDLFYTSADLGAAREFVAYCERFAHVFKVTAKDLGAQIIDERDGITAFVLRFSNGSRIVAGSSNPKFFRSKGGDADADEYAFHEQPRELFKAMHATAMVWGHQLRLWSTHNGEGSYFDRLCRGARRKDEDGGLRMEDGGRRDEDGGSRMEDGGAVGEIAPSSILHPRSSSSSLLHPRSSSSSRPALHRVTILDAVEQGLVERIKGLSAPDPVARRDWLEELHASCPDEDTWREEYLCQPGSERAALLSYDAIGACETQENTRMEDGEWRMAATHASESPSSILDPPSSLSSLHPPSSLSSPAPFYAGFDVGRKRDRSVLWVLERVGDVFHTRSVRVMENVPFSQQEDVLHLLLRDGRVKRLCVDATGIGAMLAERLRQRWNHRVEGVHFTAASKSELAMPLVRLFQDRLIRVPADPETREDLHKVRRTVTAAGNVRFDATRDDAGHADRFWALALAYHAADREPGRVFTLARKPAGW